MEGSLKELGWPPISHFSHIPWVHPPQDGRTSTSSLKYQTWNISVLKTTVVMRKLSWTNLKRTASTPISTSSLFSDKDKQTLSIFKSFEQLFYLLAYRNHIANSTRSAMLEHFFITPLFSTATSSCPAQTPGEVVPYSRVPKLTRLTFQTKTQFIQNAKKLCTESAYSSNKIHILCKSWIHWSFREVTARAFMNEATWSFICFIIQSFTDGRLSQHHYSTMMYLGFPETRATSIHMSLRTPKEITI